MPSPPASLSVDLDNRWAYMRTHGIEGWQQYPTYLPEVCERIANCLKELGLKATMFVVGKDLEDDATCVLVRDKLGFVELQSKLFMQAFKDSLHIFPSFPSLV